MPDGESIARTLLIGKRWYQKEYGVDVRIGWNPDTFGYNWQLPQIYKKAGIDYFVTQKMAWSDTNQLPFKLFWWESPDGSKVLTYFPHGYDSRSLVPGRLSADLAHARKDAPGLNEIMDLYGVGDHGGGPTRAMLDEGTHWMQKDSITPKMHFGVASKFFSDVEGKINANSPVWDYDSIAKGYKAPDAIAGKIDIPTWNDELYLEYHRGVFTTQAAHKRNMRESEEWVLNAEKYASLAWLDGKAYPATELTDAWKKVVFNDFHDLAAGSGIGIIYKDAQRDFDQVHWATNEISQNALHTLASTVNTAAAGDVPVLVFNPLAWERSGVVTVNVQMPQAVGGDVSLIDAKGHAVPSNILSRDAKTNSYQILAQVDQVPSLGYKVLHVVSGKKPFASDLKADGLTLENAAIKLVVDGKSGCITSLFDKALHKEVLAAGSCGNELRAFKDTPKDFDAWNIDPGTLDQPPTKLDNADSVELVEKGPLRAVVRVSRTWQSSKFVQDIILYTGADHAIVENNIDWHERHILLKAAFTLAATSNKATYEIPYGTIERPTTRNNSWEKARFEVPALRWADLGDSSQGFSLINESKYGYDVHDNILRLSLLRSPTSPDPEADQGHHHFSYALYPHAGDWKKALTVRHGYEFNYKLEALQVDRHPGSLPIEYSYASVHPENVTLTALKKAEDGDGLIYRMYEWAGKSSDVQLNVPAGATSATVVNLLEKSDDGKSIPVTNGRVTIPIRPYEILTVRVDYPNSGTR
jgi:alpha-mannosidase